MNSAGKGFISEEDVVGFLKKYRCYISEQEYDALMRRIDLEDDLRISYNEFLEALIPLQVPKREESEKSKNLESDFPNIKKTEEKPKSFEQQDFINNEELKDLDDEPIVSQDLENSPRFRETNEFSNEKFETPEKSKSFNSRQSSKTKNNENDKISELLILQLENERKLEHARQNLLMQENFSLPKAFKLINRQENGLIACNDLEQFFNEISLEFTSNIIISIIQEFGENESLNSEGLQKIFLPRDPDYSSLLSEDSTEPLFSSTIDKIRDVFEILISYEQDLQDFRQKLAETTEEELKDLFASLDIDDDGEISSEDLKSFFKKIGRNVSEKDRQGIIEKYSHGNQSIYFVEFKKLISPN